MYLYLVRRDAKGVKVLTVLNGPLTAPTRVGDLSALLLPDRVAADVEGLIHAHRMDWEPWVQSAADYQVLKEDLRKRGVTNVPTHTQPLYAETSYSSPHVAPGVLPKKPVMAQRAKKF